jgi:protein TonB
VENESFYPGGIEAWKRFLIKNFRTPEEAIAREISGTVVVQFIVDKEGNVSDVHAISGPEELRQEAVRVIKRSSKWEPAIQNGRKVNSYKSQPIVVQLQSE